MSPPRLHITKLSAGQFPTMNWVLCPSVLGLRPQAGWQFGHFIWEGNSKQQQMSHNQNTSSNGVWPHTGLNDFEEHRGRKESCCCEKSAVAVGCSIAVQRDVPRYCANAACTSLCVVCVFMCRSMWTYLKPAALGTLGFISLSCVISTAVFQMVQQVTQYTNQPLPLWRAPCPRIAPARSI